jgi:S1-C subfamily serine protease
VDPAPVSQVSTELIKFQSAFLVPGDSGGALFNEQWQIVGINQSDQQGEAHALPIGKIQEKLQEWRHPIGLK